MVNPFICGTVSFKYQLEEDEDEIGNPRKTRKGSKNPYSDSGLEKFSALLAELEDKKKQIYTKFGSEEISLIHFAYTNSNRCKPIVVKVKQKEHKQHEEKDENIMEANNPPERIEVQESRTKSGDKEIEDQKKQRSSWIFLKREMWRKPSYYLPAVVIFSLLFLVLFGRSFAILCTSIGWYMIPKISRGESYVKRVKKKKKDYGRRASDKGMVFKERKNYYGRRASEKERIVEAASPTSIISGAENEFSPPKHFCRRSF